MYQWSWDVRHTNNAVQGQRKGGLNEWFTRQSLGAAKAGPTCCSGWNKALWGKAPVLSLPSQFLDPYWLRHDLNHMPAGARDTLAGHYCTCSGEVIFG